MTDDLQELIDVKNEDAKIFANFYPSYPYDVFLYVQYSELTTEEQTSSLVSFDRVNHDFENLKITISTIIKQEHCILYCIL